MNNSKLGLTQKTFGRDLMALDAMNSLRLWMTSATLGLELMALEQL